MISCSFERILRNCRSFCSGRRAWPGVHTEPRGQRGSAGHPLVVAPSAPRGPAQVATRACRQDLRDGRFPDATFTQVHDRRRPTRAPRTPAPPLAPRRAERRTTAATRAPGPCCARVGRRTDGSRSLTALRAMLASCGMSSEYFSVSSAESVVRSSRPSSSTMRMPLTPLWLVILWKAASTSACRPPRRVSVAVAMTTTHGASASVPCAAPSPGPRRPARRARGPHRGAGTYHLPAPALRPHVSPRRSPPPPPPPPAPPADRARASEQASE